MARKLTRKLIEEHVTRDMAPGEEISLKIDQTLTQDETGTFLVMLELEAMELERAKRKLLRNMYLIQEDNKNSDDHLFLPRAASQFGLYFSRPGNG